MARTLTLDPAPLFENDWTEWVAAADIRNFFLDDPLLDWLNLYGKISGFTPDNELHRYDARTDFTRFILKKGAEFEHAVVRHLATLAKVAQIAFSLSAAQSAAKEEATFQAMSTGEAIIHQPVLW